MASFNRVVLMGNLTRDPEVRYTTGGTAVTDVSLAINRYRTDKNTNHASKKRPSWKSLFGDARLKSPVNISARADRYLSRGDCSRISGKTRKQDKNAANSKSSVKACSC